MMTSHLTCGDCWSDIYTGSMPFLSSNQQCQGSESREHSTILALQSTGLFGETVACNILQVWFFTAAGTF